MMLTGFQWVLTCRSFFYILFAMSGVTVLPAPIIAYIEPEVVKYTQETPVIISVDSKCVAALYVDGRIGIWNLDSGTSISYFDLSTKPTNLGSLRISDGPFHSVAVSYSSDVAPGSVRLAMFDYQARRICWDKDEGAPVIGIIIGFSDDGGSLYCESYDYAVMKIGVDAGKREEAVEFQDVATSVGRQWVATIVGMGGKRFIVSFNDSILAKDSAGKELWRWDKGGCLQAQFRGLIRQHTVGSAILAQDNVGHMLDVINLETGHVERELKGIVATDVLETSPNADRFVVKNGAGVAVQGVHGEESHPLKGTGIEWDFLFTADGAKIIGLPNFAVVARDATVKTITLHRISNVAKIFNAKTGELEREIDLTMPKDTGKEKGAAK